MSSPTPDFLDISPGNTKQAHSLAQEALTEASSPANQSIQQRLESLSKKIEALEKTVSARDSFGGCAPTTTDSPTWSSTHPASPTSTHRRNLVVCLDGTSDQFSIKNTNVVELYHRLIRDEGQLTFYNSGLTYPTRSWKSWKYFNQASNNKNNAAAWTCETIVLKAYQWLSENYQNGDAIYLFGFSRGACQIRRLSTMIDSVGLIRKGNLDQIPFAYELYTGTIKQPKKRQEIESMRRHFKLAFSEGNAKVYFVGAWDTSSSAGLTRSRIYPGIADGMHHVAFFRHALALDERRVKFLQENVRGGLGPTFETVCGKPPHTKEVWFAGNHDDIGGDAHASMKEFGPALRWMMLEAAVVGLRLIDVPPNLDNQVPKIRNSLTGLWRLYEYLPIPRLTYKDERSITFRPHCGRPRDIQPGQLIHDTALLTETPWRARLPFGLGWGDLGKDMIEVDPYVEASVIQQITRQMSEPPPWTLDRNTIAALKELISTDSGARFLRDTPEAEHTLMTLIGQYDVGSDPSVREGLGIVVDAALAVLNINAIEEDPGRYSSNQLLPVVARAVEIRNFELARQLEELLALGQVRPPLNHPNSVWCIAYVPGSDHIVTGCGDRAVRLWDANTGGLIGTPLSSHTGDVLSVAVSADATRIASGSTDATIRVWSLETGSTVSTLLGHGSDVNSVAFSPDGSRVASGSRDLTIRVWDVASSKTVVGPLQGHTSYVTSIAYSPDGFRIVSASLDNTFCLWNAKSGEMLWQAVVSDSIRSVAYAPDGKHIVTGCNDRMVRMFDAETGALVLGPLAGHTEWVNSVTFSPDGRQIASASSDRTVRLWNAETGEELNAFKGHRKFVFSVAFSSDGKKIASASDDKTVRIWDAMGKQTRPLVLG